jgi:hypothetical protein
MITDTFMSLFLALHKRKLTVKWTDLIVNILYIILWLYVG